MKRTLMFAVLLLTLAVSAFSQAVTPVPPLMNFQGRLAKPDGTPVADGLYSIVISIYDAPTGGNRLWTQTFTGAIVRYGVFGVPLGATNGAQGATQPQGTLNENLFATDRWLEVQLGSTSTPVLPRQLFLPVALAFKANTVIDNAITTIKVKDGAITNSKLAPNSVATGNLIDGAVTASKLAPGLFNPFVWSLFGNSSLPVNAFLGTTDNNPLELRVNGHRAMRYNYAENIGTGFRSINILGGSEINSITNGVIGATISGGGADSFTGIDAPNSVLFDFGTVGGGFGNTAGQMAATVGGGLQNTASGTTAVVAGGNTNTASGFDATVGGGGGNRAIGDFSTVVGGGGNAAQGKYSFAAGQHANSVHDGTFVWADSQNADFYSSGPNQVLFRAQGGVGVNKNNPLSAFDVFGDARISGGGNGLIFPDSTKQTTAGLTTLPTVGGDLSGPLTNLIINPGVVNSGKLAFDATSLNKVSNGVLNSNGGKIGIGTFTPDSTLEINDTTPLAISLIGHGEAAADTGIGHPKDGILTFFADGTEKARIVSENNRGSDPNNLSGILIVNGIAQMNGFKMPSGATAGNVLTSDANGFGTWQSIPPISSLDFTKLTNVPNFLKNGDAAGGDLTGTYPNPSLATLSSSFARVSGGAATSDGTNIGIGKSPGSRLDVAGTADAAAQVGAFRISRGDNFSKYLYMGYDAGDFAYLQSINVGVAWKPLSLNPFGGNVGIGTSSPQQKLDVNGNVQVTGGIDTISLTTRGGEFELGSSGGGVAYIDFHLPGIGDQDYNVRLANDVDGRLLLNGNLLVLGSVSGTGPYMNISDRRYKQNITTFANALDAILNLRGVTFDWKRDEFKEMKFTEDRQVGFIAQEVETVIPELVHTDKNGYKSVAYANVVPVLVEAMKQQQAQIDALKKQNATLADLKAENDKLKARNDAIEAKLKALLAAVEQIQAVQNAVRPVGQ